MEERHGIVFVYMTPKWKTKSPYFQWGAVSESQWIQYFLLHCATLCSHHHQDASDDWEDIACSVWWLYTPSCPHNRLPSGVAPAWLYIDWKTARPILAAQQADGLAASVSLLCADDFISLLHCHHIGLLGLSISSAEAWRAKQQFPVRLGHHCQAVPATLWQSY